MIRYLFERIPSTGRWLVVDPDAVRARTYAAHTLLLSRPNGYP